MKHTPEPWVTITENHMAYDLVGTTGIDANGVHWFIGQDKSNQNNFHEGNAGNDAKRIVECVNALAGIENPAEWVEKMKQYENPNLELVIDFIRSLRELEDQGLLDAFKEANRKLVSELRALLGLDEEINANELIGRQDG